MPGTVYTKRPDLKGGSFHSPDVGRSLWRSTVNGSRSQFLQLLLDPVWLVHICSMVSHVHIFTLVLQVRAKPGLKPGLKPDLRPSVMSMVWGSVWRLSLKADDPGSHFLKWGGWEPGGIGMGGWDLMPSFGIRSLAVNVCRSQLLQLPCTENSVFTFGGELLL